MIHRNSNVDGNNFVINIDGFTLNKKERKNMLPVFKKYSKFLKEMCGLELEEGYYWIDNQIIKAFDKKGVIHKLYRLKIDDNLNP